MPEIQLGAPYGRNWSSSYFPWKNSFEGYETRDDLSWNKGVHQFKFGFSWLHAPKNQELQANTQGTAVFNNSSFSKDSYINFLLGDVATFTPLQFLAGKHWVQNNYGFYVLDNWHIVPRLTLNLGLRYDALPHTYERYDQFSNFVPANYNRSLANPLNANGTLNPAALTQFNGKPFYLNGIKSKHIRHEIVLSNTSNSSEASCNSAVRFNVHENRICNSWFIDRVFIYGGCSRKLLTHKCIIPVIHKLLTKWSYLKGVPLRIWGRDRAQPNLCCRGQ